MPEVDEIDVQIDQKDLGAAIGLLIWGRWSKREHDLLGGENYTYTDRRRRIVSR